MLFSAAVRLGLRVIEDILDGAKPVFSGHDFRRKYQKSGGVRQMLKDFNTWVVEDVRKITEPGRVSCFMHKRQRQTFTTELYVWKP